MILIFCPPMLIRIVTVSLTRYKASTILPAFANCLAVLPNLHTIQVVHANTQMTTAIKTAFKGHTFLSVRTVVVPSCAHEILRRCPGVEDLTCNKDIDDESKLIGALASAKCGNLKTLRGISPNKAQAKRTFLPSNPLGGDLADCVLCRYRRNRA
jgi:hypothetical protein